MRRNLQRENFAGAQEMKQDKRNHAGAPDDPKMKKEIAKAYENYSSRFTPKPRYFMNAASVQLLYGWRNVLLDGDFRIRLLRSVW